MKYYTYIYLNPERPGRFTYCGVSFLFEPFYVGKGKGDRKYVHLTRDIKYESNKLKANKIAKLKKKFDLREYIVTIDAESEQLAFDLEKELVNKIGRRDLCTGPLCNLNEGGGESYTASPSTKEKQSKAKTGKTYEERLGVEKAREVKSKQSATHSGENNHYYGKKHSAEIIKKMVENREYAIGKNHHRYGKTHTDEVKRRLSESHKLLTGLKSHCAKFYKFISPDGVIYYCGGGFADFCTKLGLKSPSYVREVARGLRDDYCGWKCEYISREEFIESQKSVYDLCESG